MKILEVVLDMVNVIMDDVFVTLVLPAKRVPHPLDVPVIVLAKVLVIVAVVNVKQDTWVLIVIRQI